MICKQCGMTLDDSARFCSNCGEKTAVEPYVKTETGNGDLLNPVFPIVGGNDAATDVQYDDTPIPAFSSREIEAEPEDAPPTSEDDDTTIPALSPSEETAPSDTASEEETEDASIAAAAETQTTDDPSSEETTAVQPPAVAMTQTAAYQIIRQQTRKSLLFRIAICLISILFYISIMFIPLFKWNPNQANENEWKSLPNKEQEKLWTDALMNGGLYSNQAYSEYDEMKMAFQHLRFENILVPLAFISSIGGIISATYLLASLILQYLNLEDSALLVCHELKKTGKVYALEKRTLKERRKDFLADNTMGTLVLVLFNTIYFSTFVSNVSKEKIEKATSLWYPTHFAGITFGAVFVALLFIGLQVLKQYNKKAYGVMKTQIVKNEKGD